MQISGVGGGVDFAAMKQIHQQMMSKMDADGNGSLNVEEFSELHSKISANRPSGLEALGSADEVFVQIDTDGDGEASGAELKAFREANRPEMPPGMVGSDGMNVLLQAQETSADSSWATLLEALQSQDEEDEALADSGRDDNDDNASSSYFEDIDGTA